MPIRINLLAEAQTLEEQRLRDPVKRAILVGAVLVLAMLAWSLLLFSQAMIRKSELTNLEGEQNSRTNSYGQILESQRQLIENKQKIAALNRFTTNRFLTGNLLNTLQKTTVDNVQLTRLKITQTYILTEEVKSKASDEDGERVAPRAGTTPSTVTEKIVLTLNAKDNSSVAGDAVKSFQDALSSAPYFQDALGKMNEFRLTLRGAPQTDPDGKTFILFTLEANFPEKKR